MKYYVSVDFFGVEGESREDVESKVRQQINRLGIGDEPIEIDVEEMEYY